MDSTMVLKACLDNGLEDAVFYAIYDPASIDEMFSAGEGNEVSLRLGGKFVVSTMPSEQTQPLEVTGEVVKLREKQMGTMGMDGRMGVIKLKSSPTSFIHVCVVSNHMEPNNLAVFEKLDMDPYKFSFVILKSRVHWQNSKGFGPVYKAVVECDGAGVCTSDYSKCEFKNLRRPIFPLDEIEA